MSRTPSAPDAWLKLYLPWVPLPAYGGTGGVAGCLKCSLVVANLDTAAVMAAVIPHQQAAWTWPPAPGAQTSLLLLLPLLSRRLHSAVSPGTRRQHFDISWEETGTGSTEALLYHSFSYFIQTSLTADVIRLMVKISLILGKKALGRKLRKHGFLPLKRLAADLSWSRVLMIALGAVTCLRMFCQSFHLPHAPTLSVQKGVFSLDAGAKSLQQSSVLAGHVFC